MSPQILEWIVPIISGAAGWFGSFFTRYLVEKRKRKAETRQAELGTASISEEWFTKSLLSRQTTIDAAFKRMATLESEVLKLIQSESDLRQQIIEKNATIQSLQQQLQEKDELIELFRHSSNGQPSPGSDDPDPATR